MLKNIEEIRNKFPRYFGVPFSPFYDGLVSVLFKRVMIDIPKFSTWLNAPDGISDADYIRQKYGADAAEWFIKMFIDI